MKSLTLNSIQRLDDLIINLVGLRVDLSLLPDPLITEILKRAKNDLTFVIKGFEDDWDE